jgi:hypothetical protein
MAFTCSVDNRGFTFATAHNEILAAHINRATRQVIVSYAVFASRAAAVADFQGNVLFLGEVAIPFSDLGPQLVALKNAIEANLLARFPGAVSTADAG